MCDTFKGAVEVQVSPESSSDAGFEETMDLSCGKDTLVSKDIVTYMPTLPDNAGVSWIQNESPGLPYG